MVLHRYKTCPAVFVCSIQRLCKLPGVHRRGANIARLATLDYIVQGFECFLNGRVFIPAMNLIEVYVIRTEALQACLDFEHNRFARQPACVNILVRWEVDLSGNYHFFTSCEVTKRAPDNLFAGAIGVAVCSVEEVDAEFERALNERPAVFLVERPWMSAAFRHAI